MLLHLHLINCAYPTTKFLIHEIINHLHNLITTNLLTQYISFTYSLFIFTQGIKHKFINISVLTSILFTSCHALISNYIDNSYTRFILNNKWPVLFIAIIISSILIWLFDIIIYTLSLYGLFHLYDLVLVFNNGKVYIVLINFIFLVLVILFFFMVNKSKNFLFVILFSVFGTFGLTMSVEMLYGHEYGFRDVYRDALEGVFGSKCVWIVCLCLLSVFLQMNFILIKWCDLLKVISEWWCMLWWWNVCK